MFMDASIHIHANRIRQITNIYTLNVKLVVTYEHIFTVKFFTLTRLRTVVPDACKLVDNRQ